MQLARHDRAVDMRACLPKSGQDHVLNQHQHLCGARLFARCRAAATRGNSAFQPLDFLQQPEPFIVFELDQLAHLPPYLLRDLASHFQHVSLGVAVSEMVPSFQT
jgi:hypothetical protein